MTEPAQVKVELPYHLRTLAGIAGPLSLAVDVPITLAAVLTRLEAVYPMLRGTIRDHNTLERRRFLRFFAGREDITFQPPGDLLPDAVAEGKEPLTILGAIAGG